MINIVVAETGNPTPDCHRDYVVYEKDCEEEQKYGWGASKQAAIDDFIETYAVSGIVRK